MFKRILLSMLMCLTLLAARAGAADPAHGADAHGDHPAIDNRLLPIPPSRDTLISALWVIVIFVVLLAILYPTAWKQVLAGLKKREERIRRDIADAEEARRKAEATLREYTQQLATAEAKVREMISQATVQGEQLATSIRMKAQQEAEEAKERAQRDIEAAKNAAVRELHEQAADLATTIAAKILRRNINPSDQQQLVRESLEQLQAAGR
jgi:F-type H+-transporting ATPase subunit b